MSQPSKASLRRWAEAVFGLAPEPSAEAVRAAAAERLRQTDGALGGETAVALAILRGRADDPSAALRRAYDCDVERRVDEEVAGLAAEFFTLPSATRRARLAALEDRAALYPWMMARLARLVRAVDVAFVKGSEKTDRFTDMVCDLAIRSGAEHAGRRRAFLAELAYDPISRREIDAWAQRFVELAALEPEFVAAARSAEPTTRPQESVASWRKSINYGRGGRAPTARPAAPQDKSSTLPWGSGVVIFMLISGVLRAIIGVGGSSTAPRDVSRPAWQAPREPLNFDHVIEAARKKAAQKAIEDGAARPGDPVKPLTEKGRQDLLRDLFRKDGQTPRER